MRPLKPDDSQISPRRFQRIRAKTDISARAETLTESYLRSESSAVFLASFSWASNCLKRSASAWHLCSSILRILRFRRAKRDGDLKRKLLILHTESRLFLLPCYRCAISLLFRFVNQTVLSFCKLSVLVRLELGLDDGYQCDEGISFN